jgi:hypothetical protein
MTLGLDFSTAGTQFTCFTSTNVQILTREELRAGSEGSDKRETFKRDVADDLASASGLAPTNFRIKDISPGSGSIILDMQGVSIYTFVPLY